MSISWFKNDKGSTSLTVVLGVMLSVVLLASSVQWYWTNSSSSDIQTIADIGALSAADVSAKSVMTIQVLDALLLSANLFGLVLHAVVVVAGVVVVLTAPVGGAGAVNFFERAAQFDKDYCERRKQFAEDVYQFALALNEATPYLAIAQAYQVSAENSRHLEGFNGTGYVALTIPFPARGEVTLTGFPENEDQLLEEVTTAGEENRQSAERIKQLEDEIEAAIDECFRLDIYKPEGTTRPHWDPLRAPDDFVNGWTQVADGQPPQQVGLVPITDNVGNRDKLSERYRQDYSRIVDGLGSNVKPVLTTAKSSGGSNVQDLSASSLLSSEKQRRIYLVEHAQGERKAYHKDANCFGLSNAGTLQSHQLSYVIGDVDHPPCLLCQPVHWQAITAVEARVGEFVQAWNREAAALRRWYLAKQELLKQQGAIKSQTKDVLETLMKEAQSFLAGGRLSYTPAGARGFLCVVMSTETRDLPDFTMPALTGSDDVVLGRQIAMAGARLMPSEAESTIPSLLSDSYDLASGNAGSKDGFAGLMGSLVTGSSGQAGSGGGGNLAAGVGGFALRIWGSCLELYINGNNELDRLVSGLPFGLDSIMLKALNEFFDVAQIAAPDLRRPQPTLVSIADVGDVSAGGYEARMVQAIAGSKNVLEQGGGLSIAGFRENMSGMLDELEQDVNSRIEEMLKIKILGVSIPLPFGKTIQDMAASVFVVIRSKEDEFFAALGQ